MSKLPEVDKVNFEEKWSPSIAKKGFTMIPNLLLQNISELELTPIETVVLILIESHRWDMRMPYPSVEKLSKMIGVSTRTISRATSSLIEKRLLDRYRFKGLPNHYDLRQLIKTLDIIDSLNDNNVIKPKPT